MKKCVFFLVAMLLLAQAAFCANNITVSTPVPAGTQPFGAYKAGDQFSITYSATFSLIDGTQSQIDVLYDAAVFELVNPNIVTSSGVFFGPTTIPGGKRYVTDVYTTSNAYSGATTFDLQFKVITTNCTVPAQTIDVKLSTLNPPPIETDIRTASSGIAINNSNGSATVETILISGSPCIGTALYRIRTIGVANTSTFEGLYLSLPPGLSISGVWDQSGDPVSPAPSFYIPILGSPTLCDATPTGGSLWHWVRQSTSAMQYHYVLIDFSGATGANCAGTMCVNFMNETICPTTSGVYTNVSNTVSFNRCACPADPGTATIPVGDSVGNGVVIINKTFVTSNPLQYFCAPNNCKMHDYLIRVTNLSPNAVSNFKVEDFLAAINATAGAAGITVTGIDVSLTAFGAGSPTSTFDLNASSSLATPVNTVITANGAYIPVYAPGIPVESGIWPSASNPATWGLGVTGASVLPAFTTLTVRIRHTLNACPDALTDPYINVAKLTVNTGGGTTTATVSTTTFQNNWLAPAVTVAKKVRRITGGPAFVAGITAAPGETVEYQITIKNYGGLPQNVTIEDIVSSSCVDPDVLTPLGTYTVEDKTKDGNGDPVSVYSSGQIAAITASLGVGSNVGFTTAGPISIVAAASCDAVSELVITYSATIPTDPCCNSVFTNTVTLRDPDNADAVVDQPRTATVGVDRFKYIELKLEATCDTADDSSWVTGTINALRGQNIYYRASIRNNNNYILNNLRMMVQLPSGDAGATNTSAHDAVPPVTLVSSASPAGTGFWGTGPVGIVTPTPVVPAPYYLPSLSENWLSTTPSPATPTGKAIYAQGISLAAAPTGLDGGEYMIRYTIVTPAGAGVPNGSQYITAMGVGLEAGTECPFVAITNLVLNIVDSNGCDSNSGWCDCTITGDSVICVGCSETTLTGCDSGTWSTSCASVATVGSVSGVVSGHTAGTAIITFTATDGCITVMVITVNPIPVMCSIMTCTICSGELFSYTPSSTTPGATFSWTRPAVAGISNPTASGTGNPNEVLINTTSSPIVVVYAYTVTAGGCSGTHNVSVTVNPSPLNTFTVLGGGAYCPGALCPLIAINGSQVGITYNLYCGSAYTGTSAIGTGGGFFLGTHCSPGVYTVLAINTANGCSDTLANSVTVTAHPSCPITGTTLLCVGHISTMTTPCTGGAWSSTAPTVASVGSGSGIVNALSAGTTTIRYTSAQGCVTSVVVTVNDFPATPEITGIDFVCIGGTSSLTATPAPGTWMLFGPTHGSQTPSNPFVGTGVTFTGTSLGVQQIFYMYSNNCGTSLASINVTVGIVPPITGPDTICSGSPVSFLHTMPGGSWTSSNEELASVGSTGVVLANATGSFIITYTLPSGCSATKTIVIIDCPCTYICGNGSFESPSTSGAVHHDTSLLSPCWHTTEPGQTIELWGSVPAEPAAHGTQFCEINSDDASNTIYTDFNGIPGSTVVISFAHRGRYTNPDVMAVYIEQAISGSFTAPAFPGPPPGATQIGLSAYSDNFFNGWRYYSITYTLPNTPGPTRLYFHSVSTGIPGIVGGNWLDDVSINLATPPITGPDTICLGSPVSYEHTVVGGSWTGSNEELASVGSTGTVMPNALGSFVITYTLPSGCFATKTIVITECPCTYICGNGGFESPATSGSEHHDTSLLSPCWHTTEPDQTIELWGSGSTVPAAQGAQFCEINSRDASNTIYTDFNGIPGSNVVIRFAHRGRYTNPDVMAVYIEQAVSGSFTAPAYPGPPPGATQIGAPAYSDNFVSGWRYYSIYYTVPNTPGPTRLYFHSVSTGTPGAEGGNWLDDVSINLAIPVITGPGVLCAGTTVIENNEDTCGFWSSSDDSVVTVDMTSGAVHGEAGGIATITFTNCSGCMTFKTITVNPACTIAGPSTICIDSTIQLSGCDSGMWSDGGSPCVNVSGGLVTGLTAPCAATITYTSATGCMSTLTISVVNCDSPCVCTITGDATLCVNETTVLTTSCDSGTWSSSNLAAATVGPTGIVSGISAGVAVITFTSSDSCIGTITITVNPLPIPYTVTGGGTVCPESTLCPTVALSSSQTGFTYSLYCGTSLISSLSAAGTSGVTFINVCDTCTYTVLATNPATGCTNQMNGDAEVTPCSPCPPCSISGPSSMCEGQVTVLSSPCAGGTWSSDDITIGGIGITTGFVTVGTAGVVTFTYTLPSGCTYTHVVTVNPVCVITGTTIICMGSPVTLSACDSGAWSDGGSPCVNVSGGVVTGSAAPCAATITYVSPAGCLSTVTVSVINCDSPCVCVVSGDSVICTGETTVLTSSCDSGTWSSSNLAVATVGPTGICSGSGAGVAVITYTAPDGCAATFTITVNQSPAICTLSGGGVACLGVCPDISLSCSSPGINYQLYLGSSPVGAPVPGTGSTLNFGGQCAAGNYTVYAENPATGCTSTMTGSVTVTICPPCPPCPIIGANTLCVGQVFTYTDSCPGGTWSSSNNTTLTIGAGSGLATAASAGTVTITYSVGGCINTLTITINPLPGAIILAGGGTSCGSATITASGGAGGTIYFQGSTSGGTSTTTPSSSETVTASGIYYFRARSANGCWGPQASVTVVIHPLPGAVTVAGSGTSCSSATLVATLSGPGNIYYQGTTSGGTSTAPGTLLSTKVVNTTGTYYFRARSAYGCWGTEGSATVVIDPAPAAVTVGGGGTYCGSATLSATGGAGGSIYFQGTTSAGTATTDPGASMVASATGTYYFRSRSAGGCWGPQGSTTVVISPLPGAVSVTGGGTFCGSAVLTATNDGIGTIFWEGTTSNGTYTTNMSTVQTVTASGTYYFRAKSGACWGPQGSAVVTILPVPAITGTLGLCTGSTVDLNSSPAGGAWTSDNTGTATVNAATGLVASVGGAGTENIHYTGLNGCVSSVQVTVSALGPNTGIPIICMGSVPSSIVILTNSAPGGVWTSLNISKAIISPTTGAVKGMDLGTATIKYTLGGCFTTTVVTVHPAIPNIVGPGTVITGASISLTNTTTGGLWSSTAGNASVAAGAPPTIGIVTGITPGTEVIRYMVNPGCFKEKTITVLSGRPGMQDDEDIAGKTFSVFPNPSTGMLTVQSGVTGTFTLYTIDGKMVKQYTISDRTPELSLPGDLAAGIYMCRFRGDDGSSKIVRLVYKP